MLDAEQTPDSGCAEHVSGATVSPEKRQYTIKGIEADAIELMRGAARKEGMKIGAWISARMKEAAFKSLGTTSLAQELGGRRVEGSSLEEATELEVLVASVRDFDRRFRQIEEELHQITRTQRTIVSRMLEHT